MQHPDEGTIHAWLDGALSADEAARVDAHVKDCQQCQAAVAEARGFIAASSRILTALDNAPRGVIPAAAPKKRIDPMVWKIAATVLVVATGTFVVLNSGSSEDKTERNVFTAAARQESQAVSAPSTANSATPTAPVADEAATNARAGAPAGANGSAPIVQRKIATAPAAAGGVTGGRTSRESAPEILNRAAAGRGDVAERRDLAKAPASEKNFSLAAPAPLPAPPPAVAAQRAAEPTATNALAMDAATEAQSPPRVVGRPQAIGQTITVYEVARGDTVTLSEPHNLDPTHVVVTGMGQAPVDAKRARAVEKAGAVAEVAPPAAPTPPAQTIAPFTVGFDGKNTLAWTDPKTGLVNRLTGRHTRAELEQIRTRIELARAAAADSVKTR